MNIKRVMDAADSLWRNGIPHEAITAVIDPESAEEIISQWNYRNQRPRNKRHVECLAEAMRREEFRRYTSIDFAVLDGELHLINGQHTLGAIVASGKPYTLCVNLHLANSEREIEKLYSSFDIGRKRSLRDSMGGIGAELGLTPKELNSLGVAAAFINSGLKHGRGCDNAVKSYEARNHEFVKSVMRSWAKEAQSYFGDIRGASVYNKEMFYRGAVVAIGLITFREHPTVAEEFWRWAAMDDGLRNGDPRKALINWLRNNPASKAYWLQHRAAIACWNAWHDGRELHKVYPATDASLTINGTDICITTGTAFDQSQLDLSEQKN